MAHINHNTITLKLNDVYSLSLVQGKAVTPYADDYAEVALIQTDDVYDAFVPPNAWAAEWVGEDYFDSVIPECDAYTVTHLLQLAIQYVYLIDRKEAS